MPDLLEEARALLFEAVDRYPVEDDPDLWTSRVRAWLKSYDHILVADKDINMPNTHITK